MNASVRQARNRLVRTFPRELDEFRQRVTEHGNLLRTKSREELAAMSEEPEETWDVAGRPATVSVIVTITNDGSLRVVIQGFMQSKMFRRGSSVALDGFYHRPSGAIEPMLDHEFYEFD